MARRKTESGKLKRPAGGTARDAEKNRAKMPKGTITFKGELEDAGGGGVYVDFPFDIKEVFGKGGRIKIHATFDGEPYRGSLAPYGGKTSYRC